MQESRVVGRFGCWLLASWRVRLAARTGPFQGPETGSIPVRAMWEQVWVVLRVQVQLEYRNGAVAQSVRVPHCHCGGRGFEPRRPRCRICEQGKAGRGR
jgi:hypothetical protein